MNPKKGLRYIYHIVIHSIRVHGPYFLRVISSLRFWAQLPQRAVAPTITLIGICRGKEQRLDDELHLSGVSRAGLLYWAPGFRV